MPYHQVAGMTPHVYHTLPDSIDEISTDPLKENIFKMLSQISYDEFPEFVKDILVKVEGHRLFDITDGVGDEKQDILTFDRNGKRCLTQCKHTIKHDSHYNGDEVDLMVVACMRKNCAQAIFVTNSDLTPQGKKYITDEEYLRGQTNFIQPITVDYWNDIRLWQKIKNNADILHKWFSGLGQTHGLRTFRFFLTIKKLPIVESNNDGSILKNALLELLAHKLIKKEINNDVFSGKYNDHIFTIKPSLQIDTQLGLDYSDPDERNLLYNRAIKTLTIEITVSDVLEKFDPVLVRNEIIKHLFDIAIQIPDEGTWWQIVASQSSAFIYLHEIGEPREIILNYGYSFIKTNSNNLEGERDYCSLAENLFTLKHKDDDDEAIFIHNETGTEIVQWFDQRLDPVEIYNHQVIQLHNVEKFKTYKFLAAEGIDKKLIMRVRRFIPNEWTAFQLEENTIIWGIPPDVEITEVELVHRKIMQITRNIKIVKDEDRDMLLSQVKQDMPPHTSVYISGMNGLKFPVDLPARIFWLYKDLQLDREISFELGTALLEYKYMFEHEHGFDNMFGQTQIMSHTNELRELLHDLLTIRGSKMIDIGIYHNPITISVRYRKDSCESSSSLALKYIQEFNIYFEEIKTLIEQLPKDKDEQ